MDGAAAADGDATSQQLMASRLDKATKSCELFQRKVAEQETVNDKLRMENVVSEIDWVL